MLSSVCCCTLTHPLPVPPQCIENEKGSYRRVIPDREKVLLVKQKWRKKGEGCFTLTCKADAECYGKRKCKCVMHTILKLLDIQDIPWTVLLVE